MIIYTSHPQPEPDNDLCSYLSEKLGLTKNAIELGIKQSKKENAPLPIVLLSFGLINLEQYQEILNWQNNH